MKIETDHPIWAQIYPNLRNEFFYNQSEIARNSHEFEKWVETQGIKIIVDNTRSSRKIWPYVILPDSKEELCEIMFKWG